MGSQKKRILLADDDEAIIESAQHALEQQGYEVIVARDGAEALMRAERDAPDLILLDLVMPKRSGFSVLDRLRRNRLIGGPRVMVVTANDDPKHQEYAKKNGADDFLRKPFEISVLLSKVESLLEA